MSVLSTSSLQSSLGAVLSPLALGTGSELPEGACRHSTGHVSCLTLQFFNRKAELPLGAFTDLCDNYTFWSHAFLATVPVQAVGDAVTLNHAGRVKITLN